MADCHNQCLDSTFEAFGNLLCYVNIVRFNNLDFTAQMQSMLHYWLASCNSNLLGQSCCLAKHGLVHCFTGWSLISGLLSLGDTDRFSQEMKLWVDLLVCSLDAEIQGGDMICCVAVKLFQRYRAIGRAL